MEELYAENVTLEQDKDALKGERPKKVIINLKNE